MKGIVGFILGLVAVTAFVAAQNRPAAVTYHFISADVEKSDSWKNEMNKLGASGCRLVQFVIPAMSTTIVAAMECPGE